MDGALPEGSKQGRTGSPLAWLARWQIPPYLLALGTDRPSPSAANRRRNHAIYHCDSHARASSFLNFLPVATMAGAVMWLDAELTPAKVTGALVVVLGVSITTRAGRRSSPPPSPASGSAHRHSPEETLSN